MRPIRFASLLVAGLGLFASESRGNDLVQAASGGRVDTILALIASGADPNARSGGYTPLLAAAYHGNQTAIEALLAHGAEIEAKLAEDGSTPLMLAVRNGHVGAAWALLKRGANPEARRSDDVTALMVAATRGDLKPVNLLLHHGANVNARSQKGMSALILAAEVDDPRVIQRLLEAGADVSLKTTEGITALHAALIRGNRNAAKILLEHGANPKESITLGRIAVSPLMLTMFRSPGLAKYLVAHGAVEPRKWIEAGLLITAFIVCVFWVRRLCAAAVVFDGAPVQSIGEQPNPPDETPLQERSPIRDFVALPPDPARYFHSMPKEPAWGPSTARVIGYLSMAHLLALGYRSAGLHVPKAYSTLPIGAVFAFIFAAWISTGVMYVVFRSLGGSPSFKTTYRIVSVLFILEPLAVLIAPILPPLYRMALNQLAFMYVVVPSAVYVGIPQRRGLIVFGSLTGFSIGLIALVHVLGFDFSRY